MTMVTWRNHPIKEGSPGRSDLFTPSSWKFIKVHSFYLLGVSPSNVVFTYTCNISRSFFPHSEIAASLQTVPNLQWNEKGSQVAKCPSACNLCCSYQFLNRWPPKIGLVPILLMQRSADFPIRSVLVSTVMNFATQSSHLMSCNVVSGHGMHCDVM